jgi:hypothetical protein
MQNFEKELTQAGHSRRFTVSKAGNQGWEVTVEQDSQIVRRVRYTDWHRVERALSVIEEQVSQLEEAGWEDPASRSSKPPSNEAPPQFTG